MQFHHLLRNASMRKARRIGRGGKRGTYSGRGIKGLGARAGGKFRPAEREILKKIPKLRGYRFKSFRAQPAAVNMREIAARFKTGETVSPSSLHERGLIAKQKGKIPRVKILGGKGLTENLIFKDVAFSKSISALVNRKDR